jgi:hypothetical protein
MVTLSAGTPTEAGDSSRRRRAGGLRSRHAPGRRRKSEQKLEAGLLLARGRKSNRRVRVFGWSRLRHAIGRGGRPGPTKGHTWVTLSAERSAGHVDGHEREVSGQVERANGRTERIGPTRLHGIRFVGQRLIGVGARPIAHIARPRVVRRNGRPGERMETGWACLSVAIPSPSCKAAGLALYSRRRGLRRLDPSRRGDAQRR